MSVLSGIAVICGGLLVSFGVVVAVVAYLELNGW